ncbi:MAG: hypothetical protein BWY71_01328 [Planctomycetes bacterium ADurb.Bin412]|nr:MAG: hypothetical protein BWY71_01328 [Planctomycetes bacterium ADurb.Bin412]
MGSVPADGIANDGDLDIGMFDDEFQGDIFQQIHALLDGVQPRRPVQ